MLVTEQLGQAFGCPGNDVSPATPDAPGLCFLSQFLCSRGDGAAVALLRQCWDEMSGLALARWVLLWRPHWRYDGVAPNGAAGAGLWEGTVFLGTRRRLLMIGDWNARAAWREEQGDYSGLSKSGTEEKTALKTDKA